MLNEYLIKDLVSDVIDNRGKSPEYHHEITEYPIIEVNSIRGDRAFPAEDKFNKFVSKEVYEKWFRSGHPQKNDVLISTVGSGNIGEVALFNTRGCIAQNLIALRFNKELCNQEFIYYLLSSKRYKSLLVNLDIGSAQPSIKVPHILNSTIHIPDLQHQELTANLLTRLDKKVELNQKMNETLEEIAMTLFKSWFIDFDPVKAKAEGRPTGLSKEISDLFPDSFEDSELGEIPKEWTINKIKDLGKVICGKTPPTKDKENYGDGFNFITIPDMHDQVFVLESSKTITEKGAKTLKGKLLPEKTICVSCIATPGLTVIIDKPSFTNQQINSIIPYGEYLSYFLFLNFRTLGSKISIYGGGGSVFENMSKSKFEEILIKIPDEKILKYFKNHLSPIFEKILINSKENKILTEIRDTLLPKLISGELKISDTENIIEEAGI